MFIAVSTLGKVKCGEPLVMKADASFGQIGVYEIGGELVGHVANAQPEGCLDCWTVMSKIRDNRILCSGAVCFDNLLIVTTDSAVLKADNRYIRQEAAGYGILSRDRA